MNRFNVFNVLAHPVDYDVCIYHSPCPDGNACAWIVERVFPDILLVECEAGTDPDEPVTNFEGKSVLFVDIAPLRSYLLDLLPVAEKVTIIDHHATTLELRDIEDEKLELVHNERKAGSELVWEHFHPDRPVPWFITVIADRDLFRDISPDSQALSHALYEMELTRTFDGLDTLMAMTSREASAFKREMVEKGAVIVKKRNAMIRHYMQTRVACLYTSPTTGENFRMWMYTCERHILSDLGHRLLACRFDDGSYPDFVAYWSYDLENHVFWLSFRSNAGHAGGGRGGRAQVHEIARELHPDGGGHRSAAGCCLPGGTELRSIFQPV